MRFQEIIREDLDFDIDDVPQGPAQQPLRPDQERLLKRHKARQDRVRWRDIQAQRYNNETDDRPDYERTSRHPPKSLVNYKPFKTPLIRFGKFRERSRIGFDAEFRAELGNATHEVGVSAFEGYPVHDGYLVLDPPDRGVYDSSHALHSTAGSPPVQRELIRYLDQGIPMDIFLLRGHLAAFGRNKEYLSVGSDGEYLLDTNKPFTNERLAPERVYMSERLNLIQWFDTWYNGKGIAAIRRSLADDAAD